MNREKHTPPRRQFIHPMSTFYDNMPVSSPDTAEPLAPSQRLAEEQADWVQPDVFAGPTPSPWTSAQVELDLSAWQVRPSEMPSQAEQDSGRLQVASPQTTKHHLAQKPKRRASRKSRKKRVPVWLVVCSVITIFVVVLTQGNGTIGAWSADEFRAIAGPVAAAQVEAWYLNVQNKANQLQYQLGLKHITAPSQLTSRVVKSVPPPVRATMKPMPLPPMKTVVSPALSGEGVWNVLEQASGSYNYLPMDASAFIRPDPNYPYAIVTLLQLDTRFSRLHIVAGTQEPGGPLNAYGTGSIAKADQAGNTLLATLNGGFKYADGAYGLMTDGKVYVPPQPTAATIAITRSGKLIIGSWGVDPQLNSNNQDLVAWRQNASLLINNGVINPLTKDGAAWGGTILNSQYTWRSGLGITAQGNLVYAAGNALLPETLGIALHAAGAVMAMETDINPFWTRAFLYQRNSHGTLTINKLNTQMQGTGYEYLNADQRDFFYLTRYTPTSTTTTRTHTSSGTHS
ncbi:phosphodiester glycosidase family protein [Ktedonobacteria bacterium brp13]|nr:phosphodiester glycosidase family protein [Ktedonobacteria bacterium brp13]